MLLSARESARILSEAGIARAQARVLLAAGLAGRPMRTSAATLFDAAAVRELAQRSAIDLRAVAHACPQGVYVARLQPSRPIDVTAGWAALAEQLRIQPVMPSMTRALAAARIAAHGRLPWVATLCGHVVLGADATRIDATRIDAGPAGRTVFELHPPGSWFDTLSARRLPTAPGGRPWIFCPPRS